VPLGVLKEAVVRAEEVDTNKVSFQPSLPFSKVDSITNVGFGLLDKVFLHFENPFWRQKGDIFTEAKQSLFGNVTGKNPHHYMFFDVGKCLGTSEEKEPPAILMSLISGKEAVLCEQLSDEELVAEMMETLGSIFSDEALPKPIAHRITRWGQDRFSRGSYTFLPPGATDQGMLGLLTAPPSSYLFLTYSFSFSLS
jgi:lysine-specific histone demethylase 1